VTAEESALDAALRTQFAVPAPLAERLAAYGALLLEANRRVNLTAARDPAALAPHLADALTLAADVDGELIDIGSGGGLPGIPLALATGVPVVLVDAVRALVALGLAGTALAERAERLGHDPVYRGRFRAATARAVSTAPTVAEFTLPLLAIGGRALLQRGVLETPERQAVEDAAPMLGGRFAEERPLDGERRLIVLEKVAETPIRFPRRDGVPAKRPLCLNV
jgi:16S rRNA (guanine527-N7)-methyltransferase